MTDKSDAAAVRKAEAETAEASNTRRKELADGELAPDARRFVERTPRDVAINKAKEGEDTGLNSSRPDKTSRFRVPSWAVGAGRFEDFDGRVWTLTGIRESQAARIDPEAVRKDGGDPHLLGVASAPPIQIADGEVAEKSVVPTRTGTAMPSEDPVEAPKDRARIAKTDGPSVRADSPQARLAEAEGKAAEAGASDEGIVAPPEREARTLHTFKGKAAESKATESKAETSEGEDSPTRRPKRTLRKK